MSITPADAPSLPPELQGAVDELLAEAGISANRSLIERILVTGLHLGTDPTDRLDLKITAAALEEMRAAFRLFAPYADVPKVTVFGSARTKPDDPGYAQAEQVAAALAEQGWMVVTGAGPGIMEAATKGAGPRRSLGVSIRLPFEESPNPVLVDPNRVSMKYFFTRKLMLVKESRGFVCLPGGFGTLDETFELLTLQQTGKAEPVPIVLLDRPGGHYWRGLAEFVEAELAAGGFIALDDLDRVLITEDPVRAVDEIVGFWRNYDSLRWVGDRLVLRLRSAPSDAEIASLNERFAGILAGGRIERVGPYAVERSDADRVELPRLALELAPRQVGELHRLIRAIDELPSAPAEPPLGV